MRVIAGQARGRRLLSVPGRGTRPITDRAKEALFAILAPRVSDSLILDLFAGTGSVGIEALSRGARRCDFVDRSPLALRTIRANLQRTGLEQRARVWRRDVFRFLADPPCDAYDIIYVAPPQYRGWWAKTLALLDAAPAWLAPDGVVVAQLHPRELEDLHLTVLVELDRRQYGSVVLRFYSRRSDRRLG